MFCDVDNKSGDNKVAVPPVAKKPVTLEKVSAALCFIAGSVFLVLGILGGWRYFFLMGLCIAVGIMVSDETSGCASETDKRRKD